MLALIVLDPLAFVLVALVRREGVWLVVTIMALDVPQTGLGTARYAHFMIYMWLDKAFGHVRLRYRDSLPTRHWRDNLPAGLRPCRG
jgi:hypothetical protein